MDIIKGMLLPSPTKITAHKISTYIGLGVIGAMLIPINTYGVLTLLWLAVIMFDIYLFKRDQALGRYKGYAQYRLTTYAIGGLCIFGTPIVNTIVFILPFGLNILLMPVLPFVGWLAKGFMVYRLYVHLKELPTIAPFDPTKIKSTP